MRPAFELVEERARASGNLLVTLAELSRQSVTAPPVLQPGEAAAAPAAVNADQRLL